MKIHWNAMTTNRKQRIRNENARKMQGKCKENARRME